MLGAPNYTTTAIPNIKFCAGGGQWVSLAGARTVSVRSAFDDQSNRRIFKAPPLPPAANRDGSRSGHFKLTHYRAADQFGKRRNGADAGNDSWIGRSGFREKAAV
jgi:hypothetical protein